MIVNGQKVKSFDETLLDSLWNCLTETIKNVSESFEIQVILKKLGEIDQRWLLSKILGLIKTENETDTLKKILSFASGIRLKVS